MNDWMDDYRSRLQEREQIRSPSAQRRLEVAAMEQAQAPQDEQVQESVLLWSPGQNPESDVPDIREIQARELGLVPRETPEPDLLDKVRQPAMDAIGAVGDMAKDVARPFIEPFLPGSPTENPVALGVGTGIQEAFVQAMQLADEVLTAFGDKPIGINPEDYQVIPEGDSTTESLVRGFTQFMLPFKALGGMGKGASLARQFSASGLSTMLFDPEDGNLSSFLRSLNADNELIDFMDSRVGEDASAEERLQGRLKNVLEDAGLGAATIVVMRGFRYLKDHKQEVGDLLAKAVGADGPKPGAAYEQLGFRRGFAKQAGMFAGGSAETADYHNRTVAEGYEAMDVPKDEILAKTGWARGADGQWRFEISDKDAKWIGNINPTGETPIGPSFRALKSELDRPLKLGDVLDHPKLFEAYPALKNLTVQDMPDDVMKGARGMLKGNPRDGYIIFLNENLPPEQAKSTLLHEIQHDIQNIEGFAKGGGADKGLDIYMRTAGEVEARNTQRRADMTDAERRALLPEATEEPDIPRSKQIVKGKK